MHDEARAVRVELRAGDERAPPTASVKFVVGPASDTNSMSRRPLRSRAGFTGTGLAQPMTGTWVSAPSTGRTIEPNGSTCGIGLSVSRPARLAVSSPNGVRDDPVTDLVQDDRDDQRGEEDDGDVVDVHEARGVSGAWTRTTCTGARSASPRGGPRRCRRRTTRTGRRCRPRAWPSAASTSIKVSRNEPDERIDLAPFGGDLARVGEAVVVASCGRHRAPAARR